MCSVRDAGKPARGLLQSTYVHTIIVTYVRTYVYSRHSMCTNQCDLCTTHSICLV